jgi:hypothetical protein
MNRTGGLAETQPKRTRESEKRIDFLRAAEHSYDLVRSLRLPGLEDYFRDIGEQLTWIQQVTREPSSLPVRADMLGRNCVAS